jgi:RNA polymerase primary sigma factor
LAKTIKNPGSGLGSNRSISQYFSEIGKFSPLPPEREVELAIRIQNGEDSAMKELVESNLRFVVSVAKKYQGNGISLADLINEGNLGLIKGAKRFDHSRGFKFISYAVWWIRQSILQALAEQARLIRLPLNRVGTITKITKTAEKLEAEIERQPKADEISHQLSMSSDEIVNAMMYSRRHSSLDTPFQDGEDNSLMDVIENPHEDSPDNLLMRESLKEDVKLSLETLANRERTVIEMYYGISGGRALTLNEIGEIFNLTRERIRQIKAKAIQRLGHKSRSNLLRQYLG